jgi:hypothetical protein
MKLHSIEGKFNSSVFVSEEFLTIMRNLLYRDLTISSFDCSLTFHISHTHIYILILLTNILSLVLRFSKTVAVINKVVIIKKVVYE